MHIGYTFSHIVYFARKALLDFCLGGVAVKNVSHQQGYQQDIGTLIGLFYRRICEAQEADVLFSSTRPKTGKLAFDAIVMDRIKQEGHILYPIMIVAFDHGGDKRHIIIDEFTFWKRIAWVSQGRLGG